MSFAGSPHTRHCIARSPSYGAPPFSSKPQNKHREILARRERASLSPDWSFGKQLIAVLVQNSKTDHHRQQPADDARTDHLVFFQLGGAVAQESVAVGRRNRRGGGQSTQRVRNRKVLNADALPAFVLQHDVELLATQRAFVACDRDGALQCVEINSAQGFSVSCR